MTSPGVNLSPNVVLAAQKRRPPSGSERAEKRLKALQATYRHRTPPDCGRLAVQLAETLGFVDISGLKDPRLVDYITKAAEYQEFSLAWLSENVGQGSCGPAPASIVATAALQLAASRFALEKLGDVPLFSKLGDASARNLALAHELCAREAACRPREGPHALLAALQPEGAPTGGQGQAGSGESGVPVPGGQSGSGQGQAGEQAGEVQCLEVEGQAVEGGK